MSRVFMFSDMYLPTFPTLELPLYYELEKRGVKVDYVLQSGDIRLSDPRFVNLSGLLIVQKPKKELTAHMEKGNLLLSRFAYKLVAGDVAAAVRSKGHKILMHDPSGIDIRARSCPAQYLTAKSVSLKKAALKKFPKQYKHIFVTGTIHNDAAAQTVVDRDEFMKSYGLDPAKKLAILFPANPGEAGHQLNIHKDYARIVDIVKKQCPGYELVVKGHPLEYLAHHKPQPGIIHKNQHYNGKCSWEVFAPGIKVIKAEEGYMALKACDAVLNIRSSIAMETALFRKPLINIDRHRYDTHWPFDPKVMMDIKMSKLAKVLNAGKYKVDDRACSEYVKRENYSDDGKAYIRVADAAVKILNGEV